MMVSVIDIHLESNQAYLESIYGNYIWRDFTEKVALMQYTGLKDKNGKEIYEGDIVKTPGNRKAKGVFGNGAFWFVGFPFYEKSFFDRQSKTWKIQNAIKWEIIGNIYENPELIKS